MMKIKTLQWNIGGGYICREGADVALPASYTENGLNSIIDLLRAEDPDIITFQETHESPGYCQTQMIAGALKTNYWINDAYDESFLEKGRCIGQGIISRYPIVEHRFTAFTNPRFRLIDDRGLELSSKNAGLTMCRIKLPGNKLLVVETFHMTPFHFFNIDLKSEPAGKVLREVESLLGQCAAPKIVQADFNLDYSSLRRILPAVFASGMQEIIQEAPTTPKGKRLDHLLYAKIQVTGSYVIKNVKTDHYPVIGEFQAITENN